MAPGRSLGPPKLTGLQSGFSSAPKRRGAVTELLYLKALHSLKAFGGFFWKGLVEVRRQKPSNGWSMARVLLGIEKSLVCELQLFLENIIYMFWVNFGVPF